MRMHRPIAFYLSLKFAPIIFSVGAESGGIVFFCRLFNSVKIATFHSRNIQQQYTLLAIIV